MFKRIRKNEHKCRRAFTLVELIIVLVVLAVLAAMIVPALVGYINKAKQAKDIEAAEAYRVAIQAVASEYYGRMGTRVSGHEGNFLTKNIRWDAKSSDNDETDRAWGEKVLNLVGATRATEPYIMVFGVVAEENEFGYNQNQVVYVGYLADDKSPSLFYINGQWSNDYPKNTGAVYKKDNINYLKVGKNQGVKLQFFVVSNRAKTEDQIWVYSAGKYDTLEGHSAKYWPKKS